MEFDLNALKNRVQSDLISCRGGKKESIYKSKIFEGMNNADEKKKMRKKLRNLRDNLLQSIIAKPTNENLLNAFVDFYKNAYISNSYKLESVCSANASEKEKEICNQGLQIVSNFINKETKKEKKNK